MMSSNLRFGVAFYLVASVIVIGMNVNGINCEDKEVNEAKNETLTSPANETLASPANKTLIFSANETIGETDKTQIDCGPKELCDKAQIQVLTCTGNLTPPIENKNSTVDYTCSSEPKLEKLEWSYSIHCSEEDKEVTNEHCGVKITLKEADALKETPAPSREPNKDSITFLANKKVGSTNESQISCWPKNLCKKSQTGSVTCTGNLTSPTKNKTSKVDYTCDLSDVKLKASELEWVYVIICHEEKDVTNEHCKLNITLKESFTFVAGKKVGITNLNQINCRPKAFCNKAQIKVVNCTGYITPVKIKKSEVDYNCTSDRDLTKHNLESTYAIESCISERNNVTYYDFEVCVLNIELRETGFTSNHVGFIIAGIVLTIGILAIVGAAYKLDLFPKRKVVYSS